MRIVPLLTLLAVLGCGDGNGGNGGDLCAACEFSEDCGFASRPYPNADGDIQPAGEQLVCECNRGFVPSSNAVCRPMTSRRDTRRCSDRDWFIECEDGWY